MFLHGVLQDMMTLLHWATAGGDERGVNLLLDIGAELEARDFVSSPSAACAILWDKSPGTA